MSRRVLVVDDDDDIVATIRLILELDGDQVAVASSVPEALDRVETFDPDAVLADLRLRGSSGWELVERIRAGGRDVVCVVVSGEANEQSRARAERIGCRYLTKPFTGDELRDALTP